MPQDDNVIPLKIKFCFYYKDVLKQTIVTIFKKKFKIVEGRRTTTEEDQRQ